MRQLIVGNNCLIKKPILEVLYKIQLNLTNGKLRDIKDSPTNIVVTCPAHGGGLESHPACNIYVGDNNKIPYGYFNCFVCGESGDFLKFVSKCFDCSEPAAKKWLMKTFDGELLKPAFYMGEEISVGTKTVVNRKLDEEILDTYLSWTPYLAQRKLSREVCEAFKIKYDPVYRQVIFPTYDLKGNLVMLPKRSIDTKSFYLDKEVEKPVYCLNHIIEKGYKTAILTEGPFDTLIGWEYGYPTCGTFGQPSDYQIAQLNKSCINVLYLAFDNDEAGRRFTRSVKHKLNNNIITVEVKLPPGKKDLNDLSKDEFDKIIREASSSC